MKLLRNLYVTFLLAILVGCAAMPAPRNFEDGIAYMHGQNTAALEAASSSLSAKQITSQDMEKVLTLHDRVRASLEAARKARNLGDLSTSQGQLEAATAALTELQEYLRARGVK